MNPRWTFPSSSSWHLGIAHRHWWQWYRFQESISQFNTCLVNTHLFLSEQRASHGKPVGENLKAIHLKILSMYVIGRYQGYQELYKKEKANGQKRLLSVLRTHSIFKISHNCLNGTIYFDPVIYHTDRAAVWWKKVKLVYWIILHFWNAVTSSWQMSSAGIACW